MRIRFLLAFAFATYLLLLSLFYITKALRRYFKHSKKAARNEKKLAKTKRKKLLIILAFWTGILIFSICSEIVVCTAFLDSQKAADTDITIENPSKVSTTDIDSVLHDVKFQSETVNDEYTLWQQLFLMELGFDNYQTWNNESKTFQELRNKYIINISDFNTISLMEFDKLAFHIKQFYGDTYYTRTIEEIDASIPDIEQRYMLSPQLFVEEFYLRSIAQNTKYSDAEAVRQIGRSANDALKLFSVNEHSKKQLLFYASMTVAYYRLALEQYTIEGCDSFTFTDSFLIEYRIAEAFIYMYRYYNYDSSGDEYREHLLLSAEAYLLRAENRYNQGTCCNQCNGDINLHLPYFDSYMADIKHKIYALFDPTNEKLKEEALNYASRYINSPFAIEKEKNSCRHLIQKYRGN